MPGHLGRFIDGLADYCESLTCFMHTPLSNDMGQMDYCIQSKNIRLISMGPRNSLPSRMLSFIFYKHFFTETKDYLDCMLIRGPSPLLPWIAKAVKPTPVALLLVGDQLAGVDDLPQPHWRKEAIRQYWKWNETKQLEVAKNSLTFVNSHLLYQNFSSQVPLLFETKTTTLTKEDFFYREDTCQTPPYHILYVGRMDRTKGILDILEAIYLLLQDGIDVIYDLVGPENKSDPLISDLKLMAEKLNISDKVIYHGYRPIGPELFKFYRSADIFITASQSSEGFPRTIWEAMANSLPVVATKVGSIPNFITDGKEALLISPRNPLQIYQSIIKIISDHDLRKNLIDKAFNLSLENEIGKRTKEMIVIINEYLLNI